MKKIDYSLYLCTERSYLQHTTLPDAVEQAILGGCTMVQLREKDCSTRAFYNLEHLWADAKLIQIPDLD